jgi:isopentenyl diphosphate isomerase/L-lactate dehydrogenase-like FMN-dependent dehydrogenase
MKNIKFQSRRNFLKFLATSPFLVSFQGLSSFSQEIDKLVGLSFPSKLISSVDEALSVFDFKMLAKQNVGLAHWGYLESGVENDITLKANRTAFSKFYLRPRRLVGVSNIDMSLQLFGNQWDNPIMLAPIASQRAFHEEGEVAAARACGKKKHMFIMSTTATSSVEEVSEAQGQPVWYQLYPSSRWEIARGILKRVKAAGCTVIVLTVDQVAGNKETARRARRQDTRDCTDCHNRDRRGAYFLSKPMYDGLNIEGLRTNLAPNMTWDFIQRLRDECDMKLIIKGIVTGEDAKLCLRYGVDGIIVSNHGGRAEESGRGTIESLPEVVDAIEGKIPVLVDSGFRSGTDIFMGLALGAKAVCIGRPYLWGLGAFGQAGVEKVLDILRLELKIAMMNAGTRSLKEINRSFIGQF